MAAFIPFQKKVEANLLYVFMNPKCPLVTVSWNSAKSVGINAKDLGSTKWPLKKSNPSQRT